MKRTGDGFEREQKEVYEVWREEREERNDKIILISQK